MSTTKLSIIDEGLLSGSTDNFRQIFGGSYSLNNDQVSYVTPQLDSITAPSLALVKGLGILSTNTLIQIDNYSFTSRVLTSDNSSFLNDKLWQQYTLQNFNNANVFLDHKTEITVPIYKNDSEDTEK